jgi:hypothetical protein
MLIQLLPCNLLCRAEENREKSVPSRMRRGHPPNTSPERYCHACLQCHTCLTTVIIVPDVCECSPIYTTVLTFLFGMVGIQLSLK